MASPHLIFAVLLATTAGPAALKAGQPGPVPNAGTSGTVPNSGTVPGIRAGTVPAAAFEHFVTRAGDRLMDGGSELRFISFNIPNLHYIEDALAFEQTNPWRLPDEFEITDALTSVRQMGGRVVRTYALSVRRSDDDPDVPRHVLGPGQFDEEAFRALDKVLEVANRTGIRVIVPFVDQWSWWGGIKEYASFRGRPSAAFWTDPQVVADFKQTIAFVVNRRNTYTGVRYRDDKALLAWETGNELSNPPAWSRDIAEYIKSLDRNHLVVDGYHAGARGLQAEPLDDPNIDIVSTHHYPDFPVPLLEAVERARTAIAGRKVYLVGEVGFMPTDTLRGLFELVTARGISGALVWSLRFRSRDGGFYWHSEPAGGGLYKAYHWPGFPSGDAYDETALLRVMREHAFAIQGLSPPPVEPPSPPMLLPIAAPHAISWQGSAGASTYDVERATSASGPWSLVGADVDETVAPYAPLFDDEWAEEGERYFYRVRAKNGAGRSAPSNIVGPVPVTGTVIVDELSDLSRTFAHSSGRTSVLPVRTEALPDPTQALPVEAAAPPVRLVRDQPRKAKEDVNRLAGTTGSFVTYRVRGTLERARLQLFLPGEITDPVVEVSADGFAWSRVAVSRHDFSKGAGDYGYYKAVRYDVSAPPASTLLRITLTGPAEIGRVELATTSGGTPSLSGESDQ